MHRGYYRTWRKEQDSAIWRKPPLYLKLWHWLRANATHTGNEAERNLPPGSLTVSFMEMRKALAYETPVRGRVLPSPSTINDILNFLRKENMIRTPATHAGTKHTTIVIKNWDLYNPDEPVPEDSGDLFAGSTDPALSNGKPRKKKAAAKSNRQRGLNNYQPSAEAKRCLAAWARHRDLPTNADGSRKVPDEVYCKELDDIHRLDGVPWTDETIKGKTVPGIFSRCRWAVTVWSSGMIQSPSKLRNLNAKYAKDKLKEHEVIANQIVGQNDPESRVQTPNATVYTPGNTSWMKDFDDDPA